MIGILSYWLEQHLLSFCFSPTLLNTSGILYTIKQKAPTEISTPVYLSENCTQMEPRRETRKLTRIVLFGHAHHALLRDRSFSVPRASYTMAPQTPAPTPAPQLKFHMDTELALAATTRIIPKATERSFRVMSFSLFVRRSIYEWWYIYNPYNSVQANA